MVAAAATLHASGITTVQTADQAARALEPFAGDLAGLVFALGVVPGWDARLSTYLGELVARSPKLSPINGWIRC